MSDRKKREASLPPSAFTLPTSTAPSSSPASKPVSLTTVRIPGKSTPYPGRSRSMSMPPSPSPLKNMIKQEEPSGDSSSSMYISVIPSSPLKSMSTQKPPAGVSSQILSSPVKSILKKTESPLKDKTAKVLFAKDKLGQDSLLKKKHKRDKKADKKKNKMKTKFKARY
ncbi:hypothetical protein QBC41DRAFT_116613 [Cercophora samala]|uniref:Uncharacterized protein n=1 Tax=Cercophora samala TaxID=330535 RepID=A0AA39ZMT9_9PEZI|nr:hypothetical protein QBC41DRAFT_116613 [Cercophora samala]